MTSCCSLGVNAFRMSVQTTIRQLSKPCTARRQLTPPMHSSRCFSAWTVTDRQCGLGEDMRALNRISCAKSSMRTVSRAQIRTFRAQGHVVITNYIDLPPDYTDAVGLPYRRYNLEPVEVVKLFGSKVKTPAAEKLLRILHGRRVAGTLDDPTLQVNTAMYSVKEKKIALAYLRRAVPVDEITNAGLRAEDELAALEGKEGEDNDNKTPGLLSERFNPYKKVTGKPEVYAKGVFDAIRAKNTAKWKEGLRKQQEEEERRKKKEEEAAALLGGEVQTVGERRPSVSEVRTPSPSMQTWIDKAQSNLEEPPEMKKWERILPSAVAVAVFSGILVLWAVSYSPPRRADRLWPDIPPAAATVGALILANLAVYAAWRAPPLWGILNRYFLLVPATPRVISLFGASLSHQKFTHLLANMVVLWLVGTRLHDEIGRGDFLAVYLGSGAVGFLGSLMHIVLMNRLHLTSLGASGGVYGVMGAYFWMHRFEGFKLFGLPPEPYNGVPGMGFLGLLVGINVAAMFSRHASVDIASHLVAMVVGIAASRVLKERGEARRKAKEEKLKSGGILAKSVEKQSGRDRR